LLVRAPFSSFTDPQFQSWLQGFLANGVTLP
jgi:hypothetical protein